MRRRLGLGVPSGVSRGLLRYGFYGARLGPARQGFGHMGLSYCVTIRPICDVRKWVVLAVPASLRPSAFSRRSFSVPRADSMNGAFLVQLHKDEQS
ncbi:hypothetical protein M8818_007332 [Zalaria obscura]|uniref:Uncharacterized protein n=1 Tax=Zalaria obscura TaxID=2024903 RepID=A0ACC3S5V1_9PEZI